MSRREELLAWWRNLPRERQRYARLGARGALASQLLCRRGDLQAVRNHFIAEGPRLRDRYPAFWADLQVLLGELEAEAARVSA